jgi:hypothetical protein
MSSPLLGGEGVVVRNYCLNLTALKVPRQCPLVLAKLRWREGKVSGSEEGKALGGLRYGCRKEVNHDLCFVRSEF